MKKTLLALALFASLGQTAFAGQVNPGYWVDGSGQFVRSGSGECWRSGSWSEASRTPECDKMATPPVNPPIVPDNIPHVQLPVAPVTEKQALVAEVHFEFDKADLTPQARMILDDLFAKSQAAGAKIDGVWIDGHADRIGGEAYNHKLAMRRALAVSDYLASKGVAAAKMDLHEEGQSKPVVACDNVKARAALISCLAPNRRAEVKVDVSRVVNK